MKPKLIIIFLLLVLSPLALLAWLGYRAAADEQARVESAIIEARANQLTSLRSLIHETISTREREFAQLLEPGIVKSHHQLRTLTRKNRFIRQVFQLQNDKLIFPPANQSLRTESESQFFERTDSVWQSGIKFNRLTAEFETPQNYQTNANWTIQQSAVERTQQYTRAQPQNQSPISFATNQGWHTWFHGDGAQMIYWIWHPESSLTSGIEVDREALMAEVIAKLPSDTGSGSGSGTIVLTDASARPIYQWGGSEPQPDTIPDASIPLFTPLSMWHLNHYSNNSLTTRTLSTSNLLSLTSGIIAAAIALLALAIYFYRENSREMRTASEKVSFVNQVSHELKTPLTNIRMYAELAEQKIPTSEDNGAQRCLNIVINESQRLSRLISNVLTFAKPKNHEPNPTPNIPDNLIRETLDHFLPAFNAQQISIDFQANAKQPVNIDADLLEQILGNLFSNVEKYAASGKKLTITSSQQPNQTTITVTDHGPGIPKKHHKNVFKAFQRLSNKNSDGVSGTGIGLTIARDLARKHGGDLTLAENKSTSGCHFSLTLKTANS